MRLKFNNIDLIEHTVMRYLHHLAPPASAEACKKQSRHNCTLVCNTKATAFRGLNHYFSSSLDRIIICMKMPYRNKS